MIEIDGLTKRYGDKTAVDGLSFVVEPARSVHPGLSARNNLLALARTAGIGRRRVDEVIELAGLAEVARHSAGDHRLLRAASRCSVITW
jgi:ABC-type multidrug transport system ATPase subunit